MGITHSWNGTILTITSDSGTSSADLKGDKGDDGARGAQGAAGVVDMHNVYTKHTPPSAEDVTCEGDCDNVQDYINDFNERITSNANTIASLGNDLEVLSGNTQDNVDAINDAIDTINADVATNKADIATNKADIEILEAAAADNIIKHTEYDTSISRLDSNLAQLSNPNLLINGDFQVWQRGTSFSNPTALGGARKYTADRWYYMDDYVCEITKLDNGIKVSNGYLLQIIENGLKYGETYTLSAKVNGEVHTMTFQGGITSIVQEPLYYGITSKHAIGVKSDGEKIVEWIKLEQGNIATPFVPRSYAEELLLCQRYCQALEVSAVVPFGYGIFTDSLWFRMTIPLTVPMRATPTFKYTGGYLAATILNRGSQESMFDVSVQSYSGNSVTICGRISNEVGKNQEFTTLIHYDGSNNRKIIFDAEIY